MNMDNDLQAEDFEQLAEQLQVGDTQEGAQALQRIVEKAGSRRDISADVHAVLARDRVREEVQMSMAEFDKAYPDIVKDELLTETAFTAMRQEIVKDLKELGATDEVLAPIRGNTPAMMQTYAQMRIAGKGRSTGEILKAVGTTLNERYGFKPARAGRHEPAEVIRQQREARHYSTDEADIGPSRSAAAAPSEAEQKRADRARAHIDRRIARYEGVRNGTSSQNQDAY
jgi:hypothetical protein